MKTLTQLRRFLTDEGLQRSMPSAALGIGKLRHRIPVAQYFTSRCRWCRTI
jgi:hypothetical protein